MTRLRRHGLRGSPWTPLAALLAATVAHATPLIDLGAEGGAMAPVGPTAASFGLGGSAAVRGQVQLAGVLHLQIGAGLASLRSTLADTAPGVAAWGGGGVRLVLLEGPKDSLWGHLWVDAQADAIGTGAVVRAGYELGLGAQLNPVWPVGVGPFARFTHIIDAPGPRSADAFLLSVGVSFTVGSFPDARHPGTKLEVVAQAVDSDGDGIPDDRDKCPTEPETVNGFEDDDGCPDTAPTVETTTHIEIKKKTGHTDRDGDGIPDDRDRCPDQPEVFNGVDDDDGCPDAPDALVVLKADRLELKQPVKFEKAGGAVRVAKSAQPMLSAAATVLSLHPEFRAVRLSVRAEKEPTKDLTVARGERNAEALRQALVDLGLDGSRLVATGLGAGPPRVEVLLER